MITRLKLKPGQKGTKALVEKYGDDLVCVRYRYDEASRTRLKTVEIIVEKKQLPPMQCMPDNVVVPVQLPTAQKRWVKWRDLQVETGMLMSSYGISGTEISKVRNWKSLYY